MPMRSKPYPGAKPMCGMVTGSPTRLAAWLDPPQVHPGQACTGGAGSDALSQKSGLSAHPAHQSTATSVLETATIKLTSVVSDVWGKSGQSMIKAIMQGESDAQTRSRVSAGNGCRGKLPQWQEALEGRIPRIAQRDEESWPTSLVGQCEHTGSLRGNTS